MKRVEVPPSQHLVLGIQFAIVASLCLTALAIAYMHVVKAFSREIFAAISLVIGTILGAFLGRKLKPLTPEEEKMLLDLWETMLKKKNSFFFIILFDVFAS